jgi:hypothetical protein
MRAAVVVVACSGCAGSHTITVFAPVKDVPPKTDVVAAVTAGRVEEFAGGATLEGGGVIAKGRKVLVRLQPADTLVIEAGPGDRFGPIRVKRRYGDGAWIFGAIVGIGGFAASFIGTGVAVSSYQQRGWIPDFTPLYYFGAGFLGMLASVVFGSALFYVGVNGPLVVETPRLSVSPTGVVVLFSWKMRLFTRKTRLFTPKMRLFTRKNWLFSWKTRLFTWKTRLFTPKMRLYSWKTRLFSRKTPALKLLIVRSKALDALATPHRHRPSLLIRGALRAGSPWGAVQGRSDTGLSRRGFRPGRCRDRGSRPRPGSRPGPRGRRGTCRDHR